MRRLKVICNNHFVVKGLPPLRIITSIFPISDENDDQTSPTKAEANLAKAPTLDRGNVLSSPQLAGLLGGISIVLLIITLMVILSLRRRSQKRKQIARQPRR